MAKDKDFTATASETQPDNQPEDSTAQELGPETIPQHPVLILPLQQGNKIAYFEREHQLLQPVAGVFVGGQAYDFDYTQFNPHKCRAEHFLKPVTVEDIDAAAQLSESKGWSLMSVVGFPDIA